MKNYFKKQIKKSISLMLAVLMVLSCWVWVAPTEAEAADSPDEGYYYVQIIGNLTDWEDDANVAKNDWVVDYNGGSQTFTGTSVHNGGNNQNDYVLASGWVPGFPTGVKNVYQKGCGGDKWRIEVPTVYVGNGSDIKVKIGGRTDGYNAEQTSETTVTMNMDAGMEPVAKSVRNVSSASLTIPGIGTTTNAKSGAMTADVYDQYGVKLSVKPTSFYIGDSTNQVKFAMDTHGVGVNSSAQIEVSAEAQKKLTETVLYIYGQYNDVAAEPAEAGKLTLTYPTYKMNIAPNGQTGTTGAEMIMSDGSRQTADWSTTGIYGANGSAAIYPTDVAEKTGYTFKGYWTNPQPTTGNASFNAYEADFATPITSAQFDTYKNNGGTVNGNYITYDGVTYYNGGQQWSTTSRGIIGNETYNGWWISTDIPVKFYDIDGTYLGTKTFKYGMKPAATDYPDPTEEYNAGAYNYSTFSGVWQEIRGTKVTEGSYTFGVDGLMELTLTPTYTNKQYKDKYAIKFINPSNGGELTGPAEYDYRYVLGAEIPGAAAVGKPVALANDLAYSYEFAGWTTETPAAGNYHVIAEDDTSFALNSDWVVRDAATYYPVYRSTVKKYVVQFNYTDSTGTAVSKIENIAYGSAILTPDYVNTTYATGGMGYNLEGWKYINKSSQTVTLDVNASLIFSSDNVQIANSNLADGVDEKAIVFTAAYDAGIPMPYTINFKYKDAEGNDRTITEQVYHNEFITQEIVDKLNIPEQYDDGEALYTFSGMWKVTEGTSAKAEYAKDELTSFSPTSHVTFEAVYGEGVPFYTVTYIDGAKVYTERILAGSNVPAWVVDGEEYVPAMADTDIGTYEFVGWYDEAQKDADFNATNGTKYTTASTVSGDLTLYPQFKFSAFKFSIVFWNYDKSVQLAAGEYEYGQKFDDAFYRAQRAAQYRDPDEVYEYTFIGWDHPYNEDNLVCEGENIEFVAQYKPHYIYYEAEWYSSEAMTGDPLAITKHTFDSKLYAPSVSLTAPDGQIFNGWYYKDANNEAQPYVRGMKITADMSFYATYKADTSVVTYTVTAVVNGVETAYKVEAGNIAANIVPQPGSGYVDATYHKEFVGWYTSESCTEGTEFNIDETAINGNVKIYAKIETVKHTKTNKELVSAPTYYAKGSEKIWCSCDRAKTEETAEIAELTDNVAPTGTIYLGSNKWSSADSVGAAATDGNEVTLYANADTDLILTINDTGDVNAAYNPSGVGKGIAIIQGFISKGVYSQDNQNVEMSEIIKIFEDTTENLNNTANYVVKLGQFGELEDGETYVAYYYVRDKAGNVLNAKVRTAKFIYDNTAPEFAFEGNSNASKVSGTATYCEAVTVTDIEEDAVVTVNGNAVTATAEGKYVISDAGNYVITVTDKSGNSRTKKVIVAEEHNNATTEVKSTCTEDGYKKVQCAVCDYVSENKTYTAPGHDWTTSFVPATCDENGYNINVCNTCGEKETTEYINGVDGELIQAALGHVYEKDDNNEIIYTVVTEATCTTTGKKIANCARCGGATITEEIPVDEDAHTYGAIKTLKPTCTEGGKYYQTCKYCNHVKNGDAIPATGHAETYKVITTAATCGVAGVETEKCKKCDAVVGTAEIPATGKHIAYEVERKAPTATEKGYIKYACKTCTTWTKTEEIATLELYTVKFVNEDGSTIVELKDKVVGTTISGADVTAPTKEQDNTYTYTFAGWLDEANNAVELPFDVSKDITLKATFTKTTRIYTHKFIVPTKWTATYATEGENNVEFASIIGSYGSTDKKPVSTPVLKDEAYADIYTFKFLGWSTTGAAGDIVTDFTMTGDATFTAVFEAVSIEYKVTYYSGTTFIHQEIVAGGDCVAEIPADPEKAYDNDNHYAFDKWYSDANLKTEFNEDAPITAETRVYAGFTATEHACKATVTKNATCTEAGETTYTCACGYSYTEEKPEATGHTDGEIKNVEADGKTYSVVYCAVCGEEIRRTETSVTVTFRNWNNLVLKTYHPSVGAEFKYDGSTPTKPSDNQYDYTFAGWALSGTTDIVYVEGTTTATVDTVYVAQFTAAARKFQVSYVDSNNNVLKDKTTGELLTWKLEYGAEIPEYTGETLTRAADEINHYVGYTWSVAAGSEVTGETRIKPVWTAEKHNFVDDGESAATCTEPGGTREKCSACGKVAITGTTPATGHKWIETGRVDATYDSKGIIYYVCGNSNCEETKTEEIPVLSRKTITVTVKDSNGKLVEGATVELFKDTVWYAKTKSDANGKATFEVEDNGKYTVLISGVDGGKNTQYDIEVGDNGYNDNGNPGGQVELVGCSCSCHRDNFWGMIFRFFHMIISFFSGSVKCCACPDSRY